MTEHTVFEDRSSEAALSEDMVSKEAVSDTAVSEQPPGATVQHPPFRMRSRRRLLLPDLTPPTLEIGRASCRERV